MCQANEAAEPHARTAPTAFDGEEEFVLELTSHDERSVEGFVVHRKSGQREAVTEWADVTAIITRFLAAADDPLSPDSS
jgi:hypothetical protein